MQDWQALQESVGISFRNLELLQQAFVHSSYVNENTDPAAVDNERLEFLGDALLGFTIAERLYQEFPQLTEGELTEMRISLVRQETLAQIAAELRLGDYLQLGKGEESTGGRQRRTNLADVFEALIGAIYLDQGLDTAQSFVLDKLDVQIAILKNEGISRNYKALLQELTQAKYKQLPTYHTIEASGPAHNKYFVIEVALGNELLGTGSGKTKKAAEMEAAQAAWEKLTSK
ncbi:MAG: ribonuclease III [Chloroflexi bacterium]|nr:ribonuclease III [Chloroflexota bacterium]MBM3173931.1 ribonuclease III [Chloroflexota bacterium]MBM3175712.1 ribonuclease III [Chloroflexota bacterium]MBM4451356.1 ribonuclease III [Chloroflexota bacterium]MBM4453261.1 ribonuclease III [Chloroflexota bacterium]